MAIVLGDLYLARRAAGVDHQKAQDAAHEALCALRDGAGATPRWRVSAMSAFIFAHSLAAGFATALLLWRIERLRFIVEP